MFRLQEPGERGGTLTIICTPFDILSVVEELTSYHIDLQRELEKYQQTSEASKEGLVGKIVEVRLKDTKANILELEQILEDRNTLLDEVGR